MSKVNRILQINRQLIIEKFDHLSLEEKTCGLGDVAPHWNYCTGGNADLSILVGEVIRRSCKFLIDN